MRILLSLCLVSSLVACEESNAKDAPKKTTESAEPAKTKKKTTVKAPLTEPAKHAATAPAKYAVKLETTKGDIIIDVTREWSPNGADRFYSLVKAGYYDDVAFFRVISGFMAQVGINGAPKVNAAWRQARIKDDPAKPGTGNKRGFVTFAPQNLYIFQDRFRTLQRKSNPIKKTLYSVIVPQHQQIVDWLQTQPFVDPERIGFYGLSYGGKTAMRVPPLVKDYKFSICSADFNEWVWKNASTRSRYSYVWTGEYEIFEFDLGSTFNYAEMAALIAPRPFMVERGHFDGVAPDETVGYEFAKVRFLYSARLGIGDRCEIEWFVGPHSINSKKTFDFCHRHLDWPKP